MEWVVTTGRTVEEALETALDQLGVDEHDVEHEVLQEPQKGLFGRLRVEAQVRARVRPSPPPPKVDRRDRRRRRDGDRSRSRSKSGRGRSGGGSGGAGGSRGGGRSGGGSGGAGGSRGGGRSGGESPSDVRVEAQVAAGANGTGAQGAQSPDRTSGGAEAASAGSGGGGRKRRRRRRRSRSRRTGSTQGANVSETTTTTDVEPKLDIEAQRAAVEEFLRGLLDAFGRADATVEVGTAEDDTIDASVDGRELGLLVGQKGATLQSVQELVRSVVQRRFVGQPHARVRVDVAGYRERRRAALERFTIDVATSVRETGIAKALDPMGPADRKVVHDAVNTIEGVETVSEGQDADRHVVIRPITK